MAKTCHSESIRAVPKGKHWTKHMRLIAAPLLALAMLTASGFAAECKIASMRAIVANNSLNHRCVTPGVAMYGVRREDARKQLALLRDAGADMLRLSIDWRGLERSPGVWKDPIHAAYFEEVRKSGFRIKMIVGTVMAPPPWYLQANPAAKIIDERGDTCKNTIDPWYPQLKPALENALDQQLQYLAKAGLMDQIDIIVIDTGPAGEPIYPANYQLGRKEPANTFWCYSNGAEVDFRKSMKARYGSLPSLNAAWNTAYVAWDNIQVPKPRTVKGKPWEDLLLWYRNTKREFIAWQVQNFKRAVSRYSKGRISLLIYIPGAEVRPIEMTDALETAEGCNTVKIMADTKFIIDLALAEDIWMQDTGAANRSEMRNIVRLLGEAGGSPKMLWGENAGTYADPLWTTDNIMLCGLWGIDYTHATHLFADDYVTPNNRYADFATAMTALRTGKRLKTWLHEEATPMARTVDGVTTVLLPAMADASVLADFPNDRKGWQAELSVGRKRRFAIRFDLGQVPPGARIVSARLHLTILPSKKARTARRRRWRFTGFCRIGRKMKSPGTRPTATHTGAVGALAPRTWKTCRWSLPLRTPPGTRRMLDRSWVMLSRGLLTLGT